MVESERLNEWFVPRRGPVRLRVAIGLLFLPYTGMVLSYTVIGGQCLWYNRRRCDRYLRRNSQYQ